MTEFKENNLVKIVEVDSLDPYYKIREGQIARIVEVRKGSDGLGMYMLQNKNMKQAILFFHRELQLLKR